MVLNIQAVLVPQGAEHRAVCNGLRQVLNPPTVFPIPIGAMPLARCLERLHQSGCLFKGQQVLMTGLCGGLVPELGIGDRVLYEACRSAAGAELGLLESDRELTRQIRQTLGPAIKPVTAVMSERVVARAVDKRQLALRFCADVVDMEGFAALHQLTEVGVAMAMVRVVSDDCRHNIPNLAAAIDANGSLKPIPLAVAMLKQPIAALHLIYGSTKSLKILQNLTFELCKNSF
jgi:hypothetical protein